MTLASRTAKIRWADSSVEVTTWNVRKLLDMPLFFIFSVTWFSMGAFTTHACIDFDDPTITTSTRVFLTLWSGAWILAGCFIVPDFYLRVFSVLHCTANHDGLTLHTVAPFFEKTRFFEWPQVHSINYFYVDGRPHGGITLITDLGKQIVIDSHLDRRMAKKAAKRLEAMQDQSSS